MDTLGGDVVVMCTGIILVFLILVLLMFIITLEGKFFDAKANSSKRSAEKKAEPAAEKKGADVQAAAAPVVEKGIPGAVVAAIAAAISAISGGKYTLRTVRRAKNAWGNAGVNDVTSPF